MNKLNKYCSLNLVDSEYNQNKNIIDLYVLGLLEEEKKEVMIVFNKFTNIELVAWSKFGQELILKDMRKNRLYCFKVNGMINEEEKMRLLAHKLKEIAV